MNLCEFLWVTLTQLEVFLHWTLTFDPQNICCSWDASSMSSFSQHVKLCIIYSHLLCLFILPPLAFGVFPAFHIFVNGKNMFSNMFSSLVMNEFTHTFWDHFHADSFCSSLFDKSTLFISAQSEKILLNVNIRLIKSVLFETRINPCKWLLFITWRRKQPRGGNTIFTLFAQTHYQIIKV